MTVLKNKIVNFYDLHKAFCNYFMISVFVTVVDIVITMVCEIFIRIIISNTIGIISGFIVQFFLTSRHVYNKQNIRIFVKFLLTFLFGLFLANGIVYIIRIHVFKGNEEFYAFMIGKCASIAVPFFLLYFIRKYWIGINIRKG